MVIYIVFMYGHTHLPVAYEKDGIYRLNPGSISLPKGGNINSYGILEDNYFCVKSLDGDIIKEIEIK